MFEVDRTSPHDHLGIIRSAGLLTIRDDGTGARRYRLRPGFWTKAGDALEAHLGV